MKKERSGTGKERRKTRSAPRKADPRAVAHTAKREGRTHKPKGIARRDQIMDAAEVIFSERGYYGSSLREVSAQSGAALGIINHYFPSKEGLFYEVVIRKRDVLSRMVAESLQRARDANGTDLEVIEAFIRPFLRACMDHTSEIRSYIKLTSHFMSTYGVAAVMPALKQLTPISDQFRVHLREVMPDISERNLDIALYLIESALIFMVQDAGFLDALTKDQFTTHSISELIERSAVFFSGGLRALSR
jgi:AcrR family transcriptional regulator